MGLLFLACGVSSHFDTEMRLRECKEGWDSEAVSRWGLAGITETVDAFAAEVSKRMAGRCTQGPGLYTFIVFYACMQTN